jgi:hypothetical protein
MYVEGKERIAPSSLDSRTGNLSEWHVAGTVEYPPRLSQRSKVDRNGQVGVVAKLPSVWLWPLVTIAAALRLSFLGAAWASGHT